MFFVGVLPEVFYWIETIMKRNTALKILNPILLLLFINQAMSVLFREKLSRETFEFFHEGGGVILLCLIAVHIILNFNWVKANYLSR
jgi:hypothetical protein